MAVIAAMQKLQSFRQLPQGWDSYGSPSIREEALSAALAMLEAAQAEGSLPDAIVPVPGGGVQLEWLRAERELELEARPDGSGEFLTSAEDDMTEGPFAPTDQVRVRELIRCCTHALGKGHTTPGEA